VKIEEMERKLDSDEMSFLDADTIEVEYSETYIDKKTGKKYHVYYKIDKRIESVEEELI